jgi:hypothetical protein
LRLTCIGFAPYSLLPYILYTAFVEGAGFSFSGVVHTMNTGAIFNVPMLKLVIYACAASAFMVAHGVASLFFGMKKGRTV